MSEFVHQNIGDDASKPEHRLLKPHLTEKVEMVTPLTFPCKKEYERINTTLEGMKGEEILDGDPSRAPRDEEEYEPDGDDDELDDGDEGGPGPSGGKVSKKPLEASEGIFDDDQEPGEYLCKNSLMHNLIIGELVKQVTGRYTSMMTARR